MSMPRTHTAGAEEEGGGESAEQKRKRSRYEVPTPDWNPDKQLIRPAERLQSSNYGRFRVMCKKADELVERRVACIES